MPSFNRASTAVSALALVAAVVGFGVVFDRDTLVSAEPGVLELLFAVLAALGLTNDAGADLGLENWEGVGVIIGQLVPVAEGVGSGVSSVGVLSLAEVDDWRSEVSGLGEVGGDANDRPVGETFSFFSRVRTGDLAEKDGFRAVNVTIISCFGSGVCNDVLMSVKSSDGFGGWDFCAEDVDGSLCALRVFLAIGLGEVGSPRILSCHITGTRQELNFQIIPGEGATTTITTTNNNNNNNKILLKV